MKNSLQDLNNYLFESLERINDDDLTDEELEKEIKRSEAVTKVASTIINNAEVQLKALRTLTSMDTTTAASTWSVRWYRSWRCLINEKTMASGSQRLARRECTRKNNPRSH